MKNTDKYSYVFVYWINQFYMWNLIEVQFIQSEQNKYMYNNRIWLHSILILKNITFLRRNTNMNWIRYTNFNSY